MPACRVGGPTCTDGTPASAHTACSVDHPYCAPKDLCERCNTTTFQRPFDECAIDPVTTDPMGLGSHYTCTLPVSSDMNGGTKICPHTLSIAMPFPLTSLTCTNAMFHGPKKDDAWRGKIDVGNGTYTLASAVQSVTCLVSGTATKLPDDESAFPYGGLLSIDLTADRGTVAPLVFQLGPDSVVPCSATPVTVTCQQSDSAATLGVRQCLAQAPAGN